MCVKIQSRQQESAWKKLKETWECINCEKLLLAVLAKKNNKRNSCLILFYQLFFIAKVTKIEKLLWVNNSFFVDRTPDNWGCLSFVYLLISCHYNKECFNWKESFTETHNWNRNCRRKQRKLHLLLILWKRESESWLWGLRKDLNFRCLFL